MKRIVRHWLALSLLLTLTPALPTEGLAADPANLAPTVLSGHWFEVGLECTFCDTFEQQKLVKADDITLARYSDRLELADTLKSARLVRRSAGNQAVSQGLEIFTNPRRGTLALIQYLSGDGNRASDAYARVWVLEPVGNARILYGRRYLISAFSDAAFETRGRGYAAQPRYLPTERILANLEDVRVYSMRRERNLYQPGDQVRFAYEGMAAFVREGLSEQDQLAARDDGRRASQDRTSREALFKTLVRQGDEAYAKGGYEDALNRYKAASTILPEIPLVHADLGAVFQVQNMLPEAEAAYRLALELDGTDLDTRFNLGMVMEQTGRVAEALEQYRLVLEKRPADAEARDRIARLSAK